MDLHVLNSPESENHIFSVWSLCVCLCDCYQHNSKTNYSRIRRHSCRVNNPICLFVINVYVLREIRCLIFMCVTQITSVQGYTKVPQYIKT